MEFQDRLYRLRKERGISQEELADVVRVSRQAVQKWESGASRPDMDNLVAISHYFNVTLDYLILGTEVTAPTQSQPTAHLPYFEYRSKRTLFGLPLVHIKMGHYGLCCAKGIIAIGNFAVGGLAMGGCSLGVVSLGGVALGGLALGGVGVGLVALGGLAVGVLALGGGAIGVLALGGGAYASQVAAGGSAIAPIAIGDGVRGAVTFPKETWGPGTADAIRAAVHTTYPLVPGWLVDIFAHVPF